MNVLNAIKAVPEICRVFCDTTTPVQVVATETDLGCAILGVIDGQTPLGLEDDAARQQRKELLRSIGYKLW